MFLLLDDVIHNWGSLDNDKRLRDLGQFHLRNSVQQEHFSIMTDVLFDTIEDSTHEDFTIELQDLWERAMALIVSKV